MNKLFTMAIAVSALMSSCSTSINQNEVAMKLPADTALTAAEKEARIFTPEVMLKMGRIGGTVISADGKTAAYTVTYFDVKENRSYTALWTVPTEGGTPRQLTDYEGKVNSPQWSADGSLIYFLSNRGGSYQLWSIRPDGKGIKKLSALDKDINGYQVSPSGTHVWLAMSVKVEKFASSEIYSQYDKSGALIYDDLMARHWDAWEDGEYSHIFIARIENHRVGALTDINKDEPWDVPTAPYYDNAEITWNNGGTAIAYTAKKMQGATYAKSTNTDIYLYSITEESTKNLTEGMVGYDKYPVFSSDDSMVAWQSMERPGNEADKNRLFVMNVATGQKKYLTESFDFNSENLVWSADGQSIFFVAPMEATHQICRVDLADKKVSVLTQGLHDYTGFSKSGDVVIAEKTTLSMATEIFNVDLATGKDSQLTFVNKYIYDNVDMGTVEKRWVATTDGKQMLTWVIKPPKFDDAKKYPTLLYCQGGPQSVVSQRWSYRWNFQVMASQGYIVVAPNRRGLPSFGQEWLDQISGDYHGQNQRDYMSAIDDVSKEPYVDKDHLGCVGASYGGYSVYFIAGHHENRFKAFIAHCGMFDLPSFYGSTEELWFPTNDLGGAYWDKNNAVAQNSYANSPHNSVEKWNTPILIIVGLNDFRIPYAQSLEAFTAARAQGIPARLVAFKDEAHQVFGAQNALVWHSEFFNWLDKYLKEDNSKQPSSGEKTATDGKK